MVFFFLKLKYLSSYYNVSIDAVDVSAQPGVTATVTSTQILINNLEFGDVIKNESVYYYLKNESGNIVLANVTEVKKPLT